MKKSDFTEFGRQFSSNEENTDAVRRLREFVTKCDQSNITLLTDLVSNQSTYSVCELVYFEMYPENDDDRDASRQFWESICGIEHPKCIHAEAFTFGAIDACEV